MVFASKKVIVIVSALLLITSVVTVGCGQKATKGAWVNTNSLPGKTFTSGASNGSGARHSSSGIVYLGSNSDSSGNGFGPKDVSFEFQALR